MCLTPAHVFGKLAVKRVLIVEDQRILSDLLEKVISESAFFQVVGRLDNGLEGWRHFEAEKPDLVVLDVGLPGLNGVEVLQRIKQSRPQTYVMMFTSRVEPAVIQAVLKAGADAFLEKNTSLVDLEKALQFAHAGQPYYSPVAMKIMRTLFSQPVGPSPLDKLSPREKEVLQLVAEGHSNKQISSALNLSMGTVNTHRWNLMRKLDLHDAASLTRFAIEQGLTEVHRQDGL